MGQVEDNVFAAFEVKGELLSTDLAGAFSGCFPLGRRTYVWPRPRERLS